METGKSRQNKNEVEELSLQNQLEEKESLKDKLNILKEELTTNGISPELMRLTDELYVENKKTVVGRLLAKEFIKLKSDIRTAFVVSRTDETKKKISAIPLEEFKRTNDTDRKNRNTPFYDNFVDYYETLSGYIKTDILLSTSLEEALLKIQNWIEIMDEFLKQGNFLDAQVILSSLTGPDIEKLKGVDNENLDEKYQKIIEYANQIYAPWHNFANLKTALKNNAEEGKNAIVPMWISIRIITMLIQGDDIAVNNFINKFEYFNTIYQFLLKNNILEKNILSLFEKTIKPNSSPTEIFDELLNIIPHCVLNDNIAAELVALIKNFKIMEVDVDKLMPEEREEFLKSKNEMVKSLEIYKIKFPLAKFMSWLNEDIVNKTSFDLTKEDIEKKLVALIGVENPDINRQIIKLMVTEFINASHVQEFNFRRQQLKEILLGYTLHKNKNEIMTEKADVWSKFEKFYKQLEKSFFTLKTLNKGIQEGTILDPNHILHLQKIITDIQTGKITDFSLLNVFDKGEIKEKVVNYKKELTSAWCYDRAIQIAQTPKVSKSQTKSKVEETIESGNPLLTLALAQQQKKEKEKPTAKQQKLQSKKEQAPLTDQNPTSDLTEARPELTRKKRPFTNFSAENRSREKGGLWWSPEGDIVDKDIKPQPSSRHQSLEEDSKAKLQEQEARSKEVGDKANDTRPMVVEGKKPTLVQTKPIYPDTERSSSESETSPAVKVTAAVKKPVKIEKSSSTDSQSSIESYHFQESSSTEINTEEEKVRKETTSSSYKEISNDKVSKLKNPLSSYKEISNDRVSQLKNPFNESQSKYAGLMEKKLYIESSSSDELSLTPPRVKNIKKVQKSSSSDSGYSASSDESDKPKEEKPVSQVVSKSAMFPEKSSESPKSSSDAEPTSPRSRRLLVRQEAFRFNKINPELQKPASPASSDLDNKEKPKSSK